jgi:antitoxin component of RelBE/YafQ-DinJ toxin-antitoxin module
MNTTLHVTIDKATKQRAQKLAKEIGLDISTIVKASLVTFVQSESFYVEKTSRVTPRMAAVIAQARKELARGKATGPLTGSELDKFLLA